MALPDLPPWVHGAADLHREELKRQYSPCSFFWSQGQAIVLAAAYFNDHRLTPRAQGGVAVKHRHRIQLALFGQLMASLEFLLKGFIARVLDVTDTYDEKILKVDWIKVTTEQILSARVGPPTAGSMLLHPTMGWHEPETVNKRYEDLFRYQPIGKDEFEDIKKLWILRHSVAHNAGFVTQLDAARAGIPGLSERVADINPNFISEAFGFLAPIAKRLAKEAGDNRVVTDWLQRKQGSGGNYVRDKETYRWLKYIATCVESRARDLPKITKGSYTADWKRAATAIPKQPTG